MGIILVSTGYLFYNHGKLLTPGGVATIIPRPKPLLQYTYENLKKRTYSPSEINFEKVIASDSAHVVWQIAYQSDGKRVSGIANLPDKVSSESAWTKPVILLIHGSADLGEYYPGFGTEHLAQYLARNGYVTIAPDLLGYGTSDSAVKDPFEDRFLTYTSVLNLISTVCSSEFVVRSQTSSEATNNYELTTNNCQIGLWGHSNGGQIALSVLEISGLPIPTVLWNPVSKPFPYNILYYTDSFEDQGKALRKFLADFEADYDVEKYSLTNFFDWINAPVLLQQGSADPWVPQSWSDNLNEQLTMKNKKIDHKIYFGNDHNMLPNWNQAAGDALKFFNKELPL